MPSVEVGTVGGGTVLPPQAACLEVHTSFKVSHSTSLLSIFMVHICAFLSFSPSKLLSFYFCKFTVTMLITTITTTMTGVTLP